MLGEEHYASILCLWKKSAAMSQSLKSPTPQLYKGVINLRGDIVPIVDLRMKFAVGSVTYNEFTIVIMLNVFERIVGIVVDAVSDVIKLSTEEIYLPRIWRAFDSRYLKGLATVEDKMIIFSKYSGSDQQWWAGSNWCK